MASTPDAQRLASEVERLLATNDACAIEQAQERLLALVGVMSPELGAELTEHMAASGGGLLAAATNLPERERDAASIAALAALLRALEAAAPSVERGGCSNPALPRSAKPFAAWPARTSTRCMRLVYFRGLRDDAAGALVTQLCRDYETVSALHRGEGATRTLLNLYNLHAVRGARSADGALCFRTSMSGPHHYLGWLDPRRHHVIVESPTAADGRSEGDDDGVALPEVALAYLEMPSPPPAPVPARPPLEPVPRGHVLRLTDYSWLPGAELDGAVRAAYAVRDELANHLVHTGTGEADSLFDAPGVLELPEEALRVRVLRDAHRFDLRPYRAQVVRNDEPFAFDPTLVAAHVHAQHKLRVVTYHYAEDYLDGYLMHGSGVFIERHEFIQAITPMNAACSGYVLLGNEQRDAAGRPVLSLVAAAVPFGYTLLVDVGSIHGDSTLTGTYMMAMTGNHRAMRTADTVFLKHRASKRNVRVLADPPAPAPAAPAVPGGAFALVSDEQPLARLRRADQRLKRDISRALAPLARVYWRPIVATSGAWEKTRGLQLPGDQREGAAVAERG